MFSKQDHVAFTSETEPHKSVHVERADGTVKVTMVETYDTHERRSNPRLFCNWTEAVAFAARVSRHMTPMSVRTFEETLSGPVMIAGHALRQVRSGVVSKWESHHFDTYRGRSTPYRVELFHTPSSGYSVSFYVQIGGVESQCLQLSAPTVSELDDIVTRNLLDTHCGFIGPQINLPVT